VTTDAPAVEDLAAAVYVIPTDAPEADGTLAWNKTTLVLVTARIEQFLFDGALDPAGGAPTPDPGRPGLGLELRASDAERYRQA
jgi:hypothetical protein